MAKKTKEPEAVEEKAVVAAQSTLPVGVPDGPWSQDDGLDASDLILPRLLAMQGQSPLVQDGKAAVGELRDSMEGTLLGGKGKKCSVIVVKASKSIHIMEKAKGKDKFEWVRVEPFSAANRELPWEEPGENGSTIRRDHSLDFIVLRTDQIASGEAFPMMLSLRRTSYKAGRMISSALQKLKLYQKPMAFKTFDLDTLQKEKDGDKFFVFDAIQGRSSSPEELKEAYRWHGILEKSNVKVDEAGLNEESHSSSGGTDDIDF